MASTTFIAKATFSYTFRLGINLKSWNTIPIFLLKYGISFLANFERSVLLTTTFPDVGSISFNIIFIKVDLPAPDGPTKKTNSPDSIFMLTSERAFTLLL